MTSLSLFIIALKSLKIDQLGGPHPPWVVEATNEDPDLRESVSPITSYGSMVLLFK